MPGGTISTALSVIFVGNGLDLVGSTLQASSTDSIALSGALQATGQALVNLIQASAAGVSTLNGQSGALSILGAGNVTISTGAGAITISGANAGGGSSTLQVTGSAAITSPNFSGIGGTAVTLSGANMVLISGFVPVTADQLTQTGALLVSRDTTISGGLDARIQATGLAALAFSASTYATIVNLATTGTTLLGLINAASAGVSSINGASGAMTIAGAGNVVVTTVGQSITVSGNTGAYSSFATTDALTATGALAYARDLTISGGLDARIQATGLAALTYANNTFATLTNVTTSGTTLIAYTNTVSGGLDARIQATGLAALAYGNTTFATIANLTTTGVTLGASITTVSTNTQNNATNISGILTQTGIALGQVSGGLDARIQATGLAALAYGNTTFATIANLATTGSDLYNRTTNISGGLDARIQATGLAAAAYGNATFATLANVTTTGVNLGARIDTVATNLASTGTTLDNKTNSLSGWAALAAAPYLYGTGVLAPVRYIGQHNTAYTLGTDYIVVATGSAGTASGVLPSPVTFSGRLYTIINAGTTILTVTGVVGPDTNPTIAPYDALTVYATTGGWQYVGRTGYAAYATNTALTSTGVLLGARIDTVTTNTQNNAMNLSGSLTSTGVALGAVSGGLDARIQATGLAALVYGNATFATIANLGTTGSTLWNVTQNNATNISGNLTTTGVSLGSRIDTLTTNTTNNANNLSGNLTTTGATLITYVGTVSGGLQTQISGQPMAAIFVGQPNHGFSVGTVIRPSGGNSNVYIKARADSATNAEAIGIVWTSGDVNGFSYVLGGYVTTGVPAVAAGTTMFLDPTTSGALTSTEPTTVGQVSKPLMIVLESGTKGVFINMRGAQIASPNGINLSGAGFVAISVSGNTMFASGVVSPQFTGVPIAPTAAVSDNSNQVATTEYVERANRAIYNIQSGVYTLVLADQFKTLQITGNAAHTLTIPPSTGVAFPTGTRIPGWTIGAGQTTFAGISGSVVNSRGAALKSAGQFASWMLEFTGFNGWLVAGDLTT